MLYLLRQGVHMKKITILFLIAAVLGTYLLFSPSKENPIAKTILTAEISTEAGRANFAKKLQPHLDALSAKWQVVEGLQKEVNNRIAAYEKESSDAQKVGIEEVIAKWKKRPMKPLLLFKSSKPGKMLWSIQIK